MFAVILVEDANLANESLLLNVIFLTIGLSVLLHGLTSRPLQPRRVPSSPTRASSTLAGS